MRKLDEISNSGSCLNRALDNELVFVLLGRDKAAPAAIRAWIVERIRLGLNGENDPQLLEAERCADAMLKESHDVHSQADTDGRCDHNQGRYGVDG